MTDLQDDDIRAMLEARAARAPDLKVEDAPRSTELVAGAVTARRWAMSVPLVALGLVLVLVAGGFGMGRLGDGPAATRGAGVGSLTTSSSPGDRWSYQRLADALAAGDLETGSVVLIEGALERRPEACVRLALCLALQVRGLDSVSVDASIPLDRLLLEAGSHPRQALMAFRVSSEGLEFIGWPDRDPANATTIQELPTSESSDATVVPIDGWLMGPIPPPACPSGVDASLCRELPPTLRSTPPASGDKSAAVEAMEVGITIPVDPYPATIPGPFLVSRNDIDTACARRSAVATTSCVGPPMFEWTVQAALSETPVIRVAGVGAEPSPLAPTPLVLPGTTGSMDGGTFLTALRQGALDGRVIEITGRPIASTMVCDGLPGASCEPMSSWWIGGLEGNGGLPVTAMPCISECPQGVPKAGPYLFLARGTRLVYVGSLVGGLESPEAVDEGVVKVLTRSEDPHAIHAVAGWFTPQDMRVSARRPGSDGLSTDPAWWMALTPDAVDISGDTAVEGPLLIGAAHRFRPECPPDTRGCSIALVPIVLGRYDPSRVIRVAME